MCKAEQNRAEDPYQEWAGANKSSDDVAIVLLKTCFYFIY
jgi:hypothetical protein